LAPPILGVPATRQGYVLAVANEIESRRWNDERWTAAWPNREKLTSAVSPHLLRAMAPRKGQRVVDVGCGGGDTSLSLAQAVGPTGYVVGVDISAALLDLARRRARDAGLPNLTFVEADMQTESIGKGPFDVALSQFGVMFFDEPAHAFANIGRQLRGGGRLVFAAWQEVGRNPWHIGTALQPVVTTAPAPEPGKSMTGPFSLGEVGHTEGILEGAGFAHITHTAHEITVHVPASAIVDPSLLDFMGVPPERLQEALAIIAQHLDRFRVGADEYRLPLAFNVFEAANPQGPAG